MGFSVRQQDLFSARNADGKFSDGAHFSELIAAVAPPPFKLLQRNPERAHDSWDDDGALRNPIVSPEGLLQLVDV